MTIESLYKETRKAIENHYMKERSGLTDREFNKMAIKACELVIQQFKDKDRIKEWEEIKYSYDWTPTTSQQITIQRDIFFGIKEIIDYAITKLKEETT